MKQPSLLEGLIDAAVNPAYGKQGSRSLIIPNHLRQMRLFGIRQGVELYPAQDDAVMMDRKKFINELWKNNKLSIYLSRIWDLFVGEGNVIFLLRPNERRSYDIRFWGDQNYRTYYDDRGLLSEVIIVYSFKVKGMMNMDGTNTGSGERWIRLTIDARNIYREFFDMRPSLDYDPHLEFSPTKEKYPNTLGFIPCVECNNNSDGIGQRGTSDFLLLKEQIESLEKNYYSVDNNLSFFGGSTLVTTRSEGEVLEAAGLPPQSMNMVNRSGWTNGWSSYGTYSMEEMFPRNHPSNSIGEDLTLKKVIGNVDPTERFAFLTPDPVTPDHARHVRERREDIHFALGGIDELGINASASAYEMKTIYGKVAATAKERAENIYTYGLCKLFEMAIEAEENIYMSAAAQVLEVSPEEFGMVELREALEKQKLPLDLPGLIPYGSREVKWRWTGDVFEDSPRDILDKSIVSRNLQEQGVNSMEALNFVFPNLTTQEKEGMLAGGYPFRYVNSIIGTLNQMIGVYANTLNLPNPMDPSLPMASSLNILPFIVKGLETISTELSYQKPNEPTSNASSNYSQSPLSGTGQFTTNYNTGQPPGIHPRVPNDGIPPSYGSLWAAGISPNNPEFYPFQLGSQPTRGNDESPTQPWIPPTSATGSYPIPLEQSVIGGTTRYPQQSATQPIYEPSGYGDPIYQSIWGSPPDDAKPNRKPTRKRKS